VAILPLAVMAGIGLLVLARRQRSQAEQVGLELARSVATSVDAELRSSVAVLETLATSRTLDDGDFDAFRDRSRRVLELRPDWVAISLADPGGRTLVDTRSADGHALPLAGERGSFDAVVRGRRSVVGSLARHDRSAWSFSVRVPVIRGGNLRYVVTALVRPDGIRRLLERQRVPDDWVISIVDAQRRRVARSKGHEENVGGRLSPSVDAVVARGGAEGFGVARSLEGDSIYAPYSHVQPHDWTAVLGIPTALFTVATYRLLSVYGGAVLLSIALGAAAASWIARGINRPMARLRAAAQALGRRESLAPPRTSIQEIAEVGSALAAAASSLAIAPRTSAGLRRNSWRIRHSPWPGVPPKADGARSDMSKRKVSASARADAVVRVISSG